MKDEKFSIDAVAYCKMILHAMKYPHLAVRGVLLGTRQVDNAHSPEDEPAENGNSGTTTAIRIVDAIPALHNSIVTPPLEVLFIHLDSHCQEAGLSIVGTYFCNQRFGDAQ
jgi:hypothetical protein